jgi:hypothetical protein
MELKQVCVAANRHIHRLTLGTTSHDAWIFFGYFSFSSSTSTTSIQRILLRDKYYILTALGSVAHAHNNRTPKKVHAPAIAEALLGSDVFTGEEDEEG